MKKEKKLYKISQVMKLLGITGRTVRYYDQFGLLPHVKRSEGKVRLFDDKDIEVIKKIRRLQGSSRTSRVLVFHSFSGPNQSGSWSSRPNYFYRTKPQGQCLDGGPAEICRDRSGRA